MRGADCEPLAPPIAGQWAKSGGKEVGRSGERDRVRTMVGSGAARGAEAERRRVAGCELRSGERASELGLRKLGSAGSAVLLVLLRRDGRGWRRRF